MPKPNEFRLVHRINSYGDGPYYYLDRYCKATHDSYGWIAQFRFKDLADVASATRAMQQVLANS